MTLRSPADQIFSNRMPKVLYHTFGCKLNFAETAHLQDVMQKRGFGTVSRDETPDYVVINSCSVTEVADKKCRQYIRSLNRRFPSAQIIVTGCYAQLKGEEVCKLPGVKLVVGTENKGKVPDLIASLGPDHSGISLTSCDNIETFVPSCARGERTRFFLKVQDGCDYRCSYCTIPKARGKSRSPLIDELVAQADSAVSQGAKEIVLTGVNIGDFGRLNGQRFIDLLRQLDTVEGIERYRISSIEPNLLTDEIIESCAGSKHFMPHFHIPLQSGSDSVLGLMRRRYKTSLFRQRIETIRKMIPDAFIGVDIIAGSRGETLDYHRESLDFVKSIDISRLHVFAYSERPGTDALNIALKVEQNEKARRVSELLALSDFKLKQFSERYINTVRPVLLEHGTSGSNDRVVGGFTDNYLRVKLLQGPNDIKEDNIIVNVKLTDLDESGSFFKGEIVSSPDCDQLN